MQMCAIAVGQDANEPRLLPKSLGLEPDFPTHFGRSASHARNLTERLLRPRPESVQAHR